MNEVGRVLGEMAAHLHCFLDVFKVLVFVGFALFVFLALINDMKQHSMEPSLVLLLFSLWNQVW